ncbi:MAG: mannose-1-phosphate guanylyltransferase, partial [Syntrophomonadaceae bacterium]|nr:mannose-1-phosphate guanylyltransferase [Syntrophomonadaceae bacterium]
MIDVMYGVILAGGTGERFWPLSRRENPKQFLPLFGQRTMLQLTMDKLKGLITAQNVFVVTDKAYEDLVAAQLPELPLENIICEPCGRDTAAAVGLAAEHIAHRDPQGIMVVLPADHYIADVEEFRRVLKAGVEVAREGEWVLTIGIRPSRPETGYGYIQQGEQQGERQGTAIFKAVAFHEKPDLDRALKYLDSGNYLWNSGMFIWRVDLIRRLIASFLPQLDAGLAQIAASIDNEEEARVTAAVYQDLPRISIDYGIMEKCDEVLVIPATFGWDDVGSWTALARYGKADQQGNVVKARGVFLDTNDCLVYAPDRVVATLGVKDLLIVDEGDSLLICQK